MGYPLEICEAVGRVKHGLEIVRSAFWSPETCDPRAWREHWARPGAQPQHAKVPDDRIPAVHRRRMSSLARLAVQIGIEAAGESAPGFLVFCSQHGDLVRLGEMLRAIAAGAELSPIAFSQSVHNASAGLYSIIAGSRAPMTAIASGGSTFASGWLEAEGCLVTHPHAEVLLVSYDDPLPPEYVPYSTAARCGHALALLLRAAGGRGGFVLEPAPAERDEPLPLAPLFIAWAGSAEPTLRVTADGRGWLWRRSA